MKKINELIGASMLWPKVLIDSLAALIPAN